MSAMGFLDEPKFTAEAQKLYDHGVEELGFVPNGARLWAYQPGTHAALFALMAAQAETLGLEVRQRGILVTATASTLGDSYCALAWGTKLTNAADAQTAASVLLGDDEGLSTSEKAMASWARKVVRDPNGTSTADVQELRDAGYTDAQIFAITAFIAFRLAFSTVNDALGARPDAEYRAKAPAVVLDAVTYGRPIADESTAADA